MSKFKTAMEYDPEPLDDIIKQRIIETVSYIRSIDRDKLEARLIKEDKMVAPYKVFACRKQLPKETKETKETTTNNTPYPYKGRHGETVYYSGSRGYGEFGNCYHNRTYYGPTDYPMEEQCGETKEAAIEKFFTEAAKSIVRQQKIKEKEFAKLEKELASMSYIIKRISSYTKKEEVIAEAEGNKDTNKPQEQSPTIPAPPVALPPAPVTVTAENNTVITEKDDIPELSVHSSNIERVASIMDNKDELGDDCFMRDRYGCMSGKIVAT